jgi:glycosyltransferase involved in cell wall biosynthesis
VATHGGAQSNPSTSLRILCVADERPWPERSGYRIRLANVLRGLARVGTVDLLVLHGDLADAAALDPAVPSGEPVRSVRSAPLPVPVRTRSGFIPWLRSDLPRRVAWRDWSAARDALVRALDDGYDLVWWSHLDTWVAIGDHGRVPAVVDLDNLEDRWLDGRRALRRGSGILGRMRATVADRLDAIDAARWRRLQARAATVATAVVCTEADRSEVGGPHVRVVPNGYAVPGRPAGHATRPVPEGGGVLAFVGLQTYEPNIDAARFLVDEVLPHLRLVRPGVEVHLIGRAGGEVEALAAPGVHVLGEVDDLAAALDRADVVVVPIRFGAGTRIKVLEAMAHRMPIVTTTLGCEGLGLRAGVDAEIADDPAAFAAACARLLDDPARREAITDAAARLHAERYDWDTIIEDVGAIARDAVGVTT